MAYIFKNVRVRVSKGTDVHTSAPLKGARVYVLFVRLAGEERPALDDGRKVGCGQLVNRT